MLSRSFRCEEEVEKYRKVRRYTSRKDVTYDINEQKDVTHHIEEIPESPKLRVALARWSPDCNLSRAGRWIRGDGRSFEEEDGSWTEFAGERETREERWIDIDRSIERERQLIVTVKQDKTQTMKQQDKTQRQDTETR